MPGNQTGKNQTIIRASIKNNPKEKLTLKAMKRIKSEFGSTNRTTKTQGQEQDLQSKKLDNGEIGQNIKNNEDNRLTITSALQIAQELGFIYRPNKTPHQEPNIRSKIIFKKDVARERDLEVKEQIIKEIMDHRKVSREEAVRIMSNPW